MSLPSLSVSISCGSCYSEVEHNGDNYECSDCGLRWGNDPFDDDPAEFLDEDTAPCGHPSTYSGRVSIEPFRTEFGVVKEWQEWTHTYSGCNLPTGHKSDHDYPLTTTRRFMTPQEKFLATAMADPEGQRLAAAAVAPAEAQK